MSRSFVSLSARGLTVAAGPHVLLAGADLVVAPGTCLGLVGPNGSGKSTLLRALAGLEPPERGHVTLAPGSATVGYLPQETDPVPEETGYQLLARRTGVAAAQDELDRATAELAAEASGQGHRGDPARSGRQGDLRSVSTRSTAEPRSETPTGTNTRSRPNIAATRPEPDPPTSDPAPGSTTDNATGSILGTARADGDTASADALNRQTAGAESRLGRGPVGEPTSRARTDPGATGRELRHSEPDAEPASRADPGAANTQPRHSEPDPEPTSRTAAATGAAGPRHSGPASGTEDATRRAGERYAAALDRWLNLGGADLEARSAAVAADLGLPPKVLDQEVASLSGGQAARVQLAALLLARFDVFLLDEPTNDLDLDGLGRLEQFVAGLDGPVVVVSHDRSFLQRTVTAVAEIDDRARTLTRYEGGWQAYLDERQRARRRAQEAYRAYVDQRDDLTERARRQREWAARGARTAKRSGETDKHIRFGSLEGAQRMAARARRSEDAVARLDPVEKPWEGWDLRLRIADAGRGSTETARLTGAVVEHAGHGGETGFRLGPVDLQIDRGERIEVRGPNGSGKSTLLHALLGRVPLAAGHRHLGPSVVVGEIRQDRDAFAGSTTLLAGFLRVTGTEDQAEARSVLAKFGLGADHVTRPPTSLSPGERTRATLATLQARGVNLLVLDEPTNHLDLPAIEQLEQAASAFEGTLILVSHDRQLIDAVGCERVLEVRSGAIHEQRT